MAYRRRPATGLASDEYKDDMKYLENDACDRIGMVGHCGGYWYANALP